MRPPSPEIVVLDLDDTLYKERDYVLSGVKSVISTCKNLAMISPTTALKPFEPDYSNGQIISQLCNHLELPTKFEESLLWMYRLHEPTIELSAAVSKALQDLEKCCKSIAVITDGRSVTQRLKLKSLGLINLPNFVSQEFEAGKPSLDMFEAVQGKWPNASYAYVGDNPRKDFIAPNKLGWFTIGIRDDGRNIHHQEKPDMNDESKKPMAWVADFSEVPGMLFGTISAESTIL